ncbi:MAG: hypothetical protein IPO95_07515 [Rhodanobacteraceae bacterium]|nr:hypothetical protein [Rhodanobacteraceae bacterium]
MASPTALIVVGLVMAGSAVSTEIVNGPVPAIAKLMVSAVAPLALASRIACRSVFGPESAVEVTLKVIAQALGVAVETLVGEAPTATRKRGPAPKLQQQMDRITQLPKARQQFVMQVIDSMLAQSAR